MAREILFKAKKTDNGEWVEGYLVKCRTSEEEGYAIKDTVYHVNDGIINLIPCMVDESTICQYTGLTDKNGNKIWENDVVKGSHWTEREIFHNWKVDLGAKSGLIIFKDSPTSDADLSIHDFYDFDEVEVIGNIFDNPELLNMTS